MGIEEDIIERNKGNWFIQHIQRHLDKGDKGLKGAKNIPEGKVGCCICGKTVNEIADETMAEIKAYIEKGYPGVF